MRGQVWFISLLALGLLFEGLIFWFMYTHHHDSVSSVMRADGSYELAEYLTEHGKFFPLLLTGMIKIGENTGNLEENLVYLADYYVEEVDNKIAALTSLLEPVLLLVMGVMVGFVAISIILPIYSISSGLSN